MGLLRAVVICAVFGLTFGKVYGSGSSAKVTLVKAVGDNVLFNISRDPAAPYTNLTWIFKNNVTIVSVSDGVTTTDPEYVDRITLLDDGSLELRNLTLKDWGDYTVTITSTGVPEFNSEIFLDVQGPIFDVRLTASATDLTENSYLMLECWASGSKRSYAWYNQSKDMGLQPNTVGYGWGVSRYDTGPFRCEAYNDFYRVSSEEVNITISYGPDVSLTTVPLLDIYPEGSIVTVTCVVVSDPEAEVIWLYNGYPMRLSGRVLVLSNLSYDDSGRYSCQAYNRKTLRRVTKSQDIIVEHTTQPPPTTPSWGTSLKSFNMCSFLFWICCWIGLFLS